MSKKYNFDHAWQRFMFEQGPPPGMGGPPPGMGGPPPPPPGPPPAPFYEDLDDQAKLEVDMALGLEISEEEYKDLPAETRYNIVKSRNDYLKNKANKDFREEQEKAEQEAEAQQAMMAQQAAMAPPTPPPGPPPAGGPGGPPPGPGGPPPGGPEGPPPEGPPPGEDQAKAGPPKREGYRPVGMQKLSEELYWINRELNEDCAEEDEDLQEMSPTANAAGYQTPNAFAGGNNSKRKKIAGINSGMTTVGSMNEQGILKPGQDPKKAAKINTAWIKQQNALKKAIKKDPKAFKKKTTTKVKESNYAQTMREIYGLNYPSFKKNENLNSRQKVNGAIKEINSRLFKMERIINRATKLKNESGITKENYWKPTTGRVQKIAERLLSVARTLREFKS
jgi:hypothetical protein